ncbi:DNA ligase [Heracleum sosnowskyi]|uniref:DNA ligase n=1 Tax=Heracleum sosnowskyi TaxID=360622 RepID=A0AAD8JCF8_9APIA|nr:DNA ligase [Heracleum sosnowskyi]
MMKRVAYGSYGDAKTMSKFQTLSQDYQELQKEVESSRNKLENVKQRKGTLRAEVRFLRRRYRQLIESKSMTQERGKELVQQHNLEDQRKIIVKVKNPSKKEAALRGVPPVFKPNNKMRVYSGNDFPLQNTSPSNDSNHKGKHHTGKNATRFNPTTSKLNPKGRLLYKGKEVATHPSSIPMIDLNKQEKVFNANGLAATMHTPSSVLDLNENDAKESTDQGRAPIFDLNQRLVEEEEYQDNCEMARQDKLSDLKLSLCRNIGDSSNRVVKRKISWQDPVALRV